MKYVKLTKRSVMFDTFGAVSGMKNALPTGAVITDRTCDNLFECDENS
ncbi:hypothetical protein [Ruminococcus albus]|nr:hypothetical protein [Ruminococcus albus]